MPYRRNTGGKAEYIPSKRVGDYTPTRKDSAGGAGLTAPLSSSAKRKEFWEPSGPRSARETKIFYEKVNPSDYTDIRPTGALVVIKGKGKGHVAIMGVGKNSVGRDSSQRVCLDCCGQHISRENHFSLIYDDKRKKYYLSPGNSPNLVYVNGEMVAAPTPLNYGDTLETGDTLLRFIPFCDEEFNW